MSFPPLFVAEVKTESPFGFRSPFTKDELLRLAARHGSMVAIHTDPRWGGSFEWLKVARHRTDKPILAKGIHAADDEIERALDCGADRVLVVGRIPPDKYLDKVWYEPNTLDELRCCPDGVKVVWNSRDLVTGARKKSENGFLYTSLGHARNVRPEIWMCQASFISTRSDVMTDPPVQAFIVGEHLPEFVQDLW